MYTRIPHIIHILPLTITPIPPISITITVITKFTATTCTTCPTSGTVAVAVTAIFVVSGVGLEAAALPPEHAEETVCQLLTLPLVQKTVLVLAATNREMKEREGEWVRESESDR